MPDKNLSERDICTKYITPALTQVGWDLHAQIREEVTFTDGQINVRGKTVSRGAKKRANSKPSKPKPPPTSKPSLNPSSTKRLVVI